MPEISVIVPVYNVEPYLHRCVDSILAQTFTDFELILVDDGSPDNCGIICDQYSERDNRVHVIHQTNQGVSSARNVGVDCAVGKYITFVDSDDWVTERFLEIFYTSLVESNVDICISLIQEIDENGIMCERQFREKKVFQGRDIIDHFGNRDDNSFHGPWSKLIKASICKAVRFPVGRAFDEDFATVYQWYNLADSVLEINDVLYIYSIRSDSAIHREYSLDRLGAIDTLEELLAFFEKNHYKDLYNKNMFKYVYCLSFNINNLRKIPNEKKRIKLLKKKLKSTLKENKISLNEGAFGYETLHPWLMYLYWALLSVKKKINKLVKSIA